VLGPAYSLSEDELVQGTRQLFGYQRTGVDINRRMREVIHQALTARVIEEHGGRYRMVKDDEIRKAVSSGTGVMPAMENSGNG